MMTQNHVAGAAFLLFALAGCGQGADAPQNVTSIEVPEGNAQQRIQAMPEGERNAVFIRAIRDAGIDCQHVESSAYRGELQGQPNWSARCTGGGEYSIVIERGGTALVVADPQAGNAAAGNAQ